MLVGDEMPWSKGTSSMSLAARRLQKVYVGAHATVSVDFGSVLVATDPTFLGMCSSTYGRLPTTNSEQASAERAIDARYCRIPVKWDGTKTVSSAVGAPPNAIKPLVDVYRSWGYRCLIVIAGRTGDFQGYQSGDASAIVGELGTTGIDYSGPNEPWLNGGMIQGVIDRSIEIYNELQTVTAGTKVWGPVHYMYARSDMTVYMDGMGMARLAGVDYHNYAMGNTYLTTSAAFDQTPDYSQQIAELRADLAGRGLPQQVNVDELNFSWRSNNGVPESEGGFVSPQSGGLIDGRFFSAVNTVWMASAIGHVLSSGGRAMPYATQNQALGVMVQNEYTGNTGDVPGSGGVTRPNSSPMPAYWAIAMWTGGGTPNLAAPPASQVRNFPHFNNAFFVVTPHAAQPLTEVFAVNNEADGYNIVIVNKRASVAARVTVQLSGVLSGHYDAWQTSNGPYPTQYLSPTKIVANATYSSSLTFFLPACTVTTVVLMPGV